MSKQITTKDDRLFQQDDAGRWTMVWEKYGLTEKVSEAEVIDVLERNKDKAALHQHFPMRGFHDRAPIDKTPSHKQDY